MQRQKQVNLTHQFDLSNEISKMQQQIKGHKQSATPTTNN